MDDAEDVNEKLRFRCGVTVHTLPFSFKDSSTEKSLSLAVGDSWIENSLPLAF